MTKFVHGEDMSSMIYFLVEKGSCVTCWPDANGLTPLHRAASLGMPFNIEVIRSILYHFPQSAEVCDTLGNSILHLLIGRMPSYLEGKNLLKFKEIFALRNYQDQRGNTPLHIAARSKDINMVRVLLEFSTKLSIKNKEGISVASLIQQHNLHEVLRKRKLTPEECKATNKPNISFLRERMSKLGEDFLLSQDSKERNVLHRLMEIKNESHIIQDDFIDFVQQILEKFPKLVCQTDVNGDTPIHILVRNNPDSTIYVASGNRTNTNQNVNDFIFSSLWRSGVLSALLELCNQCNLKIQREESAKEARYDPPWLVQNALGNTPLHEALIANNHVLVRRLLALDRRSAGLVNKCKETPLHLIGGRPMYMEQFKRKDIELMVEAKAEAAYWPDQDGLTPILRAFQVGDLSTATILCSISPEAAKICDANDQSFWHLLVNHPSIYYVHLLLQNQTLRELLGLKDKNGDTPLHLAIQENRFDIVQVFLDTWERERESSRGRHRWLVDLLDLQNKAGVRSMWGIPTSQMKTYVNTMGIIAALLTTITFTAAFAVPGGLIENVGTPVLIERVAFQVFMISDELAMCLSMMVLFCLLWIMATNNRHNSVKILDFSVTLLLASFYATIVTFMTGLFATLFSVKPWTAIVTLILCSLLMLLVHKYLVIKFLIPFKNVIRYFFWMFLRFARKICTKIIKWCTAMARKFIGCCKPKPSNGADGQGRTRQRSVIIV
uniref:PGG domain-containing protein n=1 Tax=Chenopodium quinoa TaxID=63459 RepID=A0A803KQH7_CHEQI